MTVAAAARGRAERDQHSVLAESVEPVTDALPGRRRRLNVIAKSSSAVLVTVQRGQVPVNGHGLAVMAYLSWCAAGGA